MTIADLEHFKNLLLEREHNLNSWLGSAQAVGERDVGRVRTLLGDIKSALGRVENHSYGECKVCLGKVEHYLLEIQPVAQVCLDCISDSEKESLQEELFLASKFHRALLPQKVARIDGFDIAVKSFAARTVGGDYYDFLPGDGGSMRVVIADIMGKGLPAGLMMSNVQGSLRILAEEIQSSALLVSRLNKLLCRNLPVIRFVSMICLSLRPDGKSRSEIAYANAGHSLPVVMRAEGSIERLESTGGVLGVHEDFAFEERIAELSTGDLLLLFTDGVTEEENKDGEMFGEERLIEFLKYSPGSDLNDCLENLMESVRKFSGKTEMEDDLTVLAIRKT